jgi:hypothetical protein
MKDKATGVSIYTYKGFDPATSATMEIIWKGSTPPTPATFDSLIGKFKEKYRELGGKAEPSDEEMAGMDLGKADQKTFEAVRQAQEMKKRRPETNSALPMTHLLPSGGTSGRPTMTA